MNELKAIKERHSVRRYLDQSIAEDIRAELDAFLAEVNEESGLNITIQYDDPDGFDSKMAHYGDFQNVSNYIVLKGENCPDFEERCGYYGEKLVLKAQMLGLNTCWAALTFNKAVVKQLVPDDERLCMVIALGYGETAGKQHRNKSYEAVVESAGNDPEWFRRGVLSALLAPTAMNQQRFRIIRDGETVSIIVPGLNLGVCLQVDLGIVEYHFEVASGRKVFGYEAKIS